MKKDKQNETISTFLGSDVSVEGSIEFQGTIRLDGKVKGKIHSEGGTLIIGEQAVLNADVAVDVAIITGALNGSIDARNKIEIFPPARVSGDIKAPTISIAAGVVFNGNCEMKGRAAAPPVRKEKSTEKAP